MDVSIVDLLSSGLKLMCIGMGIVFLFLLLLVGVIQQTHAILRRLEHRSATPHAAAPRAVAAPATGADDEELVAAIAAAIHQYEQI